MNKKTYKGIFNIFKDETLFPIEYFTTSSNAKEEEKTQDSSETKNSYFSVNKNTFKFKELESINSTYINVSSPEDSVIISQKDEIEYKVIESEKYLEEIMLPRAISYMKQDYFIFNQRNQSITFVEGIINNNETLAGGWLNKLYLKCFKSDDDYLLLKFLQMMEFIYCEKFQESMAIFALGALAHENDQVKEIGIRIIENMPIEMAVPILKKIDTGKKWIEDYINELLEDFTEE